MFNEMMALGSGGGGGSSNSAAGTFTTTNTSSLIHIPLDFKPSYVWYRKMDGSAGRECIYNSAYSTTQYRFKGLHNSPLGTWTTQTISSETEARGGFYSCDDVGGFTIRGTEDNYAGNYYFFACDNAPTETTVTPT